MITPQINISMIRWVVCNVKSSSNFSEKSYSQALKFNFFLVHVHKNLMKVSSFLCPSLDGLTNLVIWAFSFDNRLNVFVIWVVLPYGLWFIQLILRTLHLILSLPDTVSWKSNLWWMRIKTWNINCHLCLCTVHRENLEY